MDQRKRRRVRRTESAQTERERERERCDGCKKRSAALETRRFPHDVLY